jgi:hypothetical protein
MRFPALLIAGCLLSLPATAQKLKFVQFSSTADFGSYKTYSWTPVKTLENVGIVENNPTFTPVVKEAINQAFAAKGLKEVPSGGDLDVVVIGFRYASPQTEQLSAISTPTNASWAFGGPTKPTVNAFNEEGSMAVNLIDNKLKTSSWLSMATSSLDKKDQAKNAERVRKIVAKMFEHFPPKAKR